MCYCPSQSCVTEMTGKLQRTFELMYSVLSVSIIMVCVLSLEFVRGCQDWKALIKLLTKAIHIFKLALCDQYIDHL